jgi:homogentisate 1,2-dioxygenase
VEAYGSVPLEIWNEAVLRHHHLKTGHIKPHGTQVSGRVPLLANDDVILSRCLPTDPQTELYRNASADEVIFVHQGTGALRSMFGLLPFKACDYIVVPRCTTHRLEFDSGIHGAQPDLLIIESQGSVIVPPRYLQPDGQIRLGSPYGERDFHGPRETEIVDSEKDVTVLIKDGQQLTRYTLAHHPFDVVGWDGMLYPYTFNADDFEPITGTFHQPPPIHQTFEAPGFVICTFAPRMLDTHPEAIRVPWAHSNVQADEVLFYVRGHFSSRKGVEEASITIHPRGIPHGPHPGTIVASRNKTHTDELAVMMDTVKPLSLTRQAIELDDANYPYSWLEDEDGPAL